MLRRPNCRGDCGGVGLAGHAGTGLESESIESALNTCQLLSTVELESCTQDLHQRQQAVIACGGVHFDRGALGVEVVIENLCAQMCRG